MGGSSGTGLRLDTVCYRMAPAEVSIQSTKTVILTVDYSSYRLIRCRRIAPVITTV